MSVMLTPSAVSPPSANSTPCMSSTTETHSTPVYGPTSIAARAPPSRWPLVPAPTGKLSIWTAKMNAATRPASGAVRSAPPPVPEPAPASSRRAPRRLTATAAAATTPAAADTGALMNPSGTCISGSPLQLCNPPMFGPPAKSLQERLRCETAAAAAARAPRAAVASTMAGQMVTGRWITPGAASRAGIRTSGRVSVRMRSLTARATGSRHPGRPRDAPLRPPRSGRRNGRARRRPLLTGGRHRALHSRAAPVPTGGRRLREPLRSHSGPGVLGGRRRSAAGHRFRRRGRGAPRRRHRRRGTRHRHCGPR